MTTTNEESRSTETPTATALAETLAEIRDWTVYRLANEADAGSSDFDVDGAGARFLTSVRDDVLDRVEYATADTDADDLGSAVESLKEDAIHEIADAAPDVYNFTRWSEFVDLAAWQEDISEYGEPEDLTGAAGFALYMIAERLAVAVLDTVIEAIDGRRRRTDHQSRARFTRARARLWLPGRQPRKDAMTRYSKFLTRKRREYGDKFSDSDLPSWFVHYFNTGDRVKVTREDWTRTGTVGVTTGWRPAFLLMHRSNADGSSDVLSDRDEIVAVWDGHQYRSLDKS